MATICVFCGSSAGARPAYREAAAALGHALVAAGHGLVYGGGNVGLMGVVADAVLAAGGTVVGVIPEALLAREVGHLGLTELHVTSSMHERKALMAERADAFVALPGGLGTWEELFEILTWAQLGEHAKPVVVLDVDGFYEPLFVLLQHAVDERFVTPHHAGLARRATTVDEAMALVASAPPEPQPKWIRADET